MKILTTKQRTLEVTLIPQQKQQIPDKVIKHVPPEFPALLT